MLIDGVAVVCVAWYIFIACVCTIGEICLYELPPPHRRKTAEVDLLDRFLYYRRAPPRAAVLSRERDQIPHVTVIRPCKGREPYLYECLRSTLFQDYPADKLTVHFCVSSRSDGAYETIEKVVRDHPGHDAQIFIEAEDDEAAEATAHRDLLGPNPKIRNMSRAYRKAKGDLIWIIDCNVWVGRGACGRMVDKLCGFSHHGATSQPYKLVHHLPISVDVDEYSNKQKTNTSSYDDASTTTISPSETGRSTRPGNISQYGGRLEELFLSSSHAKMYVAINMVAVAPCIVGKSNMFRRSHLDHLTAERAKREDPTAPTLARTGIDYFSHNICEDHLIGDLLWKSTVPDLPEFPPRMRNHGLVLGDLAIQPVAGMTVVNYVARRVRWLRVRKFTVPAATIVEPGTESFLCSACGAFGVTTCQSTQAWFGNTWGSFFFWWTLSIILWASVDWQLYQLLHSGRTLETNEAGADDLPAFARPLTRDRSKRPFKAWLLAWLGREALALPIWTWAIWGGVTVTWRDHRFWVGIDMKVHEICEDARRIRLDGTTGEKGFTNGHLNGTAHGKRRTD
ncbi:ceramide glucosyltransferase [Capronia epimyces CBS 606.96]|uniref:Ceramide glucosyltransferase n=1 Tax=Capronia epimyces CBS 606.96 TaxID=1182542 RepID=W9YFM0_9EURO|nr:ceramide glucosyltransferase [Capronia epimyces CBS 606.96]EXJ91687.1 ceramide glucosyltransferase [Capronia epimyces CBS 606.96]